MRFQGLKFGAALAGALMFGAAAAHANVPVDGKMGLQPAASAEAAMVTNFHTYLLVIITVITVFVFALMLWVIFRYKASSNPTPAKFSHQHGAGGGLDQPHRS